MSDNEEPEKPANGGELERAEDDYEKLHSARQHLSAAVADVKQFVDEDLAKLAKGTVDRLDDTVTSGITSAVDAMIKALEDIKQRLRKD